MITSLQNTIVKNIAQLSDKKKRDEQGLFVAEGIKVCKTLISDGIELVQLLLLAEHVSDFSAQSIIVAPKIILVNQAVIRKLSQFTTPSGAIGVFKIKKNLAQHCLSRGLVLYNVQDPGNVGTLMRSCAAMDAKDIVFVNSVDPYHPKVVQASAGTLAHLNISVMQWSELMQLKRQEQFKLAALVVQDGTPLEQVNTDKTLFVVGNESNGLRKDIINQCDERVTLTMSGNIESLNVSVAGSIALYVSTHKTK